MKIGNMNSVRFFLSSIQFIGMIVGLLFYNQVLSLVGRIVYAQYLWAYVFVMFVVSIFVASGIRRSFRKDINSINSLREVSILTALRTFIGGLLAFYSVLGVVSTSAYVVYLIFHLFFLFLK